MTHIPPDLRAEFKKLLSERESKMYGYYKSVFVDEFEGGYSMENDKSLLFFIAEREKKAREEAFIEGQKHAFGVDKERVAREARKEEREKIRTKVAAIKPILWNDDVNRHLENVAKSNILDKVLALLAPNPKTK